MSTFYHIAIIVEDLDKAMEEFGAGLGVHWGEVRDGVLGPWTYRLTFSYEGPPHIELIEGQPGSPWDTSRGPRPDHIGYWTDDIEEGKRRLIARGLPIDFDACPYGSPFSYHRAAHTGLRVELVDVSRQPWFLATYGRPDGGIAKAYYSTVFARTAEQVWAVIRDFNSYPVWFEGVAESHIAEGKAGDAVGAVRDVRLGDTNVHHIQRLLAHSDLDRSYTYEFLPPLPYPVHDFQATLRVTPIVDGDRAFVEWWATFDCAADECDHWTAYFAHEVFAKGLLSLRAHLTG